MAITLGANQYGKSEVRLVAVDRGQPEHRITDLTVSTALRGDLADTHLRGDNAKVLATDTQKNTVYAFARQQRPGEPEDFGLRLARHFTSSQPPITGARVTIEQHGWERITTGGAGHPHSFRRSTEERRTAEVTVADGGEWVVSGLAGLTVLKSTGSEFHGFPRDGYTTLAETDDRILATAVSARWRHRDQPADWAGSFGEVRRLLLEAFADTHSLSLQQTLYAMGERVLAERAEVAEIRLSLPNRHHFLVDLSPFGLDNPGEVFHAADRPYGLIEGTVTRDDAEPAGRAWGL